MPRHSSTERFAIPGVGGIVLDSSGGRTRVLIQDRHKAGAEREAGLIEIPAGKVREFESVYDCLRREIREETGYELRLIEGEDKAELITFGDYSVLNYEPFASAQNLAGDYPIMVQVFICHAAEGTAGFTHSDESRNVRWVGLDELGRLLTRPEGLYPMHVSTFRKFIERYKEAGTSGP